jgi:hypothetical protein
MLIKMSGEIASIANNTAQNEKRAALVYAGTFNSMDGEVTITPAHIEVLCRNHNEKLEKLGGEVKISDYPPVQVDHSTSAHDTVGRLIGEVDIGTYQGQVALFGTVRILGQENWEKVADGRWTHLSIGADLEAGIIQEITVTPFPAAQGACFLSKKGVQHMGKKKLVSESETDETKEHEEKETKEEGDSKEEAKLSADSDADDETKLSADNDEDEDEDEKKKLAEKEEAEKDEEEAKNLKAKLSAFSAKSSNIRLALKTANVKTRFARLRSQAKVTPAELKKMDFAKLCASNDATIDAVLATYESREPVIFVGQYGSIKASNASEVAKQVRLSAQEEETRARFTSIPKKSTKLSSVVEMPEQRTMPVEDDVKMSDDTAWNEIVRAIEGGNHDDGKKIFSKMCKFGAESSPVAESDMAELMGAFADLESDHTEIVRLMSASIKTKL